MCFPFHLCAFCDFTPLTLLLFSGQTCLCQELTYTVKQQIQLLNQKIEALESKAKSSGLLDVRSRVVVETCGVAWGSTDRDRLRRDVHMRTMASR